MSKYRIVRTEKYDTLYDLQRWNWFCWINLMWGTENECKYALNNIKKHGTLQPVVYEEEF